MKRIYLVLFASITFTSGPSWAGNTDPSADSSSAGHETKAVKAEANTTQNSMFESAPVKPKLSVSEIKAQARAEAKALAEEKVQAETKARADAKQARLDAQAKALADAKARAEEKAKAEAEASVAIQERGRAAMKAQARNQAKTEAEVNKELEQNSEAARPAETARQAPAKTPTKGTLEDQLKSLDFVNAAPAAANREKLYAVQERYLPLRWKSEITFGAASNLTGDSFLRTQQIEAAYHLHLSDRWSLGLAHAWVDNQFKSDANALKNTNGAIPDLPYAISRSDLTVEYNVFYGKFRWSAETVSYFDQYLAIGAGNIEQNTGTTTGYVADAGFAFWIGKFASTRLGLKDYYYKESYRSGPEMTNNIHAHLDLGYLF